RRVHLRHPCSSWEAADARKLQRRATEIDAGDEAEQIDLDALVARERETQQAGDRELVTRAARGQCDELPKRQIVLADGDDREREAQLRNLPRQVRNERVAVRPRPDAVRR